MALLCLGVLMAAKSGVIFTRDGKVLSGRIELRSGSALRIIGPGGTHQLPLGNVRRAVFGADIGPTGLRHIEFSFYRGTWLELPDFSALKSSVNGRLPGRLVTLYPHNAQVGYALLFSGELHAPIKGVYQFYLGSDDGTRLFLDGKPVIDNDGRHGYRERQGRMNLAAGRHLFRLDYFNHSGAALLRLDWSGPGLARTPLSREGTPPASHNADIDSVSELAIRQPGVLAWNGTFIAHEAVALGESKLTFAAGTPDEIVLSTVNTSALFFQAISVHQAQALRGNKPGVLLTDGNFFEGKIMKLEDGEVEVQSILFGRKTYKLGNTVVAVLLRSPKNPHATWRVRTRAGMLYVGTNPKTDNASLHFDADPLVPSKLLRDEIKVIEYGTLSSPLAKAWRRWDGLDTAARAHLKSRESIIAARAKAVAQALRQQSQLRHQQKDAIGNLSRGEGELQKLLKKRQGTATQVNMARADMENAGVLAEEKSQALDLIKNKVTQAKVFLGEKEKSTAAIQVRLDKFTAKAVADEKLVLAAIAKQKTDAVTKLKVSEVLGKQHKMKAFQNQQAAGSAATNRVKALAALALAQKKLVQVQARLASETKEKTKLETQMTAAKAVTDRAQQAQQAAQTMLTAKQTLLNSAKAALSAAVDSKESPAAAKLKVAEKTFQKATISKAMADKQLAEFKIELADLEREKMQAMSASADLKKIHDAKKKLVDAADVSRAKAEAMAVMADQKSDASRTALVNLVSGKQEPALAAVRVATNSVAKAQVVLLQASGKLQIVQTEAAVAAKTAKDTEAAAKAADVRSKSIQKDVKKSASEKSVALKKAIKLRQVADAAKAVLANLEKVKLQPTQAQVATANAAMAKAKSNLVNANKALPALSRGIQTATTAFMRDDQAARNMATKAAAAGKLHETLRADLAFIAKQQDSAFKAMSVAEMTRDRYDKRQVAPAAELVVKNQQVLADVGKMRAAVIREEVAAKAGVKSLGQALQISMTNLNTARLVFDKAVIATDAARARLAELGKQLVLPKQNLSVAKAKILVLDRDVKQAAASIKQAETEELARLKPAAESRAALELGLLEQAELKKKLASDEKSFKASLEDLKILNKMERAAIVLVQQAAQKMKVEQEKKLAEAIAGQEVATVAREEALESLKQAKLAHDKHLKGLAEQSRTAQIVRAQVRAMRVKRAEAEAAWLKFLFANRALLNLN